MGVGPIQVSDYSQYHYLGSNVVKTIINHPPITINGWYKPFPNGVVFDIVLPTKLYKWYMHMNDNAI